MKKTLIAAAVAAVFSASSMAQNLGFESGNTTGWTSTTLSAVGSTTTQAGSNNWVINPYGSYMGQLQIQSGNFSQMTSALGLTGSSSSAITTLLQQQAATGGGNPNPTTAGWVTKEVTLTAGQTFTLAWQYVSVDYVPFNDGSIATLTQNGTNVATVNNYNQQYALLGFTNPGTGDYSTGSYGATGWQVATFQVSVDGTYTLGFGVFNLGDTALSPVLYIDEVQGTTTLNGQSFGAVAPNNSTAPSSPSVTPPAPTTVSTVASGTTADTSNLASNVTVNGGTIQIASNNITLTNTFTTNSGGMTVDQNGNTVDFSGVISGSGGVTISNTSTGGGVTFSAVNTYTGTTTVNSGASLTNTGTIVGAVTNLGAFTNSGTTGNVTNGFNGDGNTASLINSGTTGNVTNWSSFANSGTTGTVTNFGTFNNTGTTGTFNNAGVLNNTVGGVVNELGYNNHWVQNSGTINNITYNGGTVINNANGTIGTINNTEAHGTFHNDGTVTGNVTTNSTFNNNSTGVVQGLYTNDGTLNNAGTLNSVTNNATFNNQSGGTVTGLTTNTGILNNGGTLASVNNTGTLNATGGSIGNLINNGTFDISGVTSNPETILGQVVHSTEVGSLTGSGSVVTGSGNNYVNITNASGEYSGIISGSGGVLVSNGTQTLSGNNTYTGITGIGNAATVNNTGTLVGDVINAGTFTNNGTTNGVGNSGTFTNNATVGAVINTESGTVTNNGTAGTVINAGWFTNALNAVTGYIINSFNFTNNGDVSAVNNTGSFTNNGAVTTGSVSNNGTFVNNGTTGEVHNEGTFTNNGTVASLITNQGTFNNNTTAGDVLNEGTFNNVGTVGYVDNFGTFTNNGTVGNWNNSSVMTNSGTMGDGTNSGSYTNTGTVGNVANSGTMTNSGNAGTITNTGTLTQTGGTANVNNTGSFTLTGGTLGAYTQTAPGTTVMFYGTPFTVTGAAHLGGGLMINNSPTAYGKYNVLLADSISGSYNSFTSSGVNDYLKYSGSDVKLYVTPSAGATQASINNVASSLGNAVNLQSANVTNSLGNDCNLFGDTGSCVSVNLSQIAAAGGDLNTGGITVGKRINDNWRFGLFTNAPFNSTTVGTIGVKSTAAYGGYVTWNKNANGTGLGITTSAAQGNGSMNITRNGPEAGVGTSSTGTTAYQIKGTYAVPVTETVTVTPYVGIRQTQTSISGYTEQGPVFPLTVNGTNQNATDAIAGVAVSKQLTENLSANVGAGVIQRISQTNATFTGTSEIGGLNTFSGAVPTNGSTNPALSAGLGYNINKTTRVGASLGWQQRGSNADVTTIGVNLTKGF